ncbi:MAG TPA: exodeoxyribonuclease V subunit alpha [Macromonas sp.]|nr:exodeoxyribonuclease V subunit alpha [Macromonas sp.]
MSHLPQLHPGAWDAVPITPLDRAFARFLQERQPSADPRHTWLALLVSHQFGRGHACLDLSTLQGHAADALGWNAEQCQRLPIDLSKAVHSLPWAEPGPGSAPLVLQGQRLYLRRAWQAEQDIRTALLARVQADVATEDGAAPDAATGQSGTLGNALQTLFPQGNAVPASTATGPQPDWQKVACALAARGRLLLLTGGPGTGKTTTVARLLALLQSQACAAGQPLRIHLTAPTGKAAARLSASLRDALDKLPATFRAALQAHPPGEAQTLHRLLRIQPGGASPAPEPLPTDLVVVDEASMIDLEMMARLLACVPLSARLVLLGDKDQLASVEAGAVWAQLCEGADQGHYSNPTVAWLREHAQEDVSAWAAPASPAQIDLWADNAPAALPWAQHTVKLRHSRRFSAEGGIGQWANALNLGQAEAVAALWQALPLASEAAEAAVARLAPGTLPRSAAWAQALRQGWADWLRLMRPWQTPAAYSENTTSLGVDDATARQLLNAFGRFQVLCAVREGPWGVQQLNRAAALALQCPAEGWYPGRPVMVTRNDTALGLMNGDVGLCLPHDGRLRVAFPVGEHGVRWVAASRLEAVETVFAMTVHKSQGSEFEQVLLVLPDQLNPVLTRELLYTGLTRAKSRALWHVPEPDVLLQAVTRRVWRSGGLGLSGWHNAVPT